MSPVVETPLGSPERVTLEANADRREELSAQMRRTLNPFKYRRLYREWQRLNAEFDIAFWGRRDEHELERFGC